MNATAALRDALDDVRDRLLAQLPAPLGYPLPAFVWRHLAPERWPLPDAPDAMLFSLYLGDLVYRDGAVQAPIYLLPVVRGWDVSPTGIHPFPPED